MDQPLSSLVFRGTIAEAITEAKLQKKLFVVYIAGDEPESRQLETSTWNNPIVSETLTKYCIFLHVLEGSSEASYFSAIYPQNYTPCITAIGYNGLQLWRKEGFVSADLLATSLEKAWLSLHLQDTTAAFLSATLASRISGSPVSEQEQQSVGVNGSLPSRNDLSLPLEAENSKNNEAIAERNSDENSCEETDSKSDGGTVVASHTIISTSNQTDVPYPTIDARNVSLNPQGIGQSEPEVSFSVSEKGLDFGDLCSGSCDEVPQGIVDETIAVPHAKRLEIADLEKGDALDSPAIKSNYVVFNIRLPEGSLQANFSVTDTLRTVHEYIDDNQTSSLGSYNLAIPYPRHVFSNQDLECTLSALGFFNRQTLIVIQHNQTKSNYREGSSVHSSKDISSSNGKNEGYWAPVKRLLSYVNPLSYLSGGSVSSSSGEEPPNGPWQFSPNSSRHDSIRGSGSSSIAQSSDQNTPESGQKSNSRSRKRISGFGANIHTLKSDEDDDNDRNVYWNGNSTQFGGNNDGR